MGLDVGVFGSEKLFSPFDSQVLRHVHIYTPAIITFARITFRVFVGLCMMDISYRGSVNSGV